MLLALLRDYLHLLLGPSKRPRINGAFPCIAAKNHTLRLVCLTIRHNLKDR